jgi:hypothetical protein
MPNPPEAPGRWQASAPTPDPTPGWKLTRQVTEQGLLVLPEHLTAHQLLIAAEELEVAVGPDATLFGWASGEGWAELLFQNKKEDHRGR